MDIKELGLKIKEAREGMGLSLEALYLKSKVAKNTINALEKGHGNPTVGTLETLERHLGIELINPRQLEPDWVEAARILNKFSTVSPLRRLSALYLLTKDEAHLTALEQLPYGLPLSRVLRKAP